MAYTLVRHKVKDFDLWKKGFNDHAETRKQHGAKGGMVLRNVDDPNEVIILIEGDDLDKARQFIQSDDLREKMKEVGVTDQPDIYFLEQVDGIVS